MGTTVSSSRAQRFNVGYHLNSWDLAGKDNDAALAFLAAQGFSMFEVLASTTLDDTFTRQYMGLGPRPPVNVMTDTRFFERLAVFSRAERTHGIQLSSLYVNAEYINDMTFGRELDQFEVLCRFLTAAGSRHLVVGGGPSAAPGEDHSREEYRDFGAALTRVGQIAADQGLMLVYHPHIDTFVETRGQLDRMMDVVDTDLVGLCVDTAHLQQTHSDPVAVLRDYLSVVRYVHLKDTLDADRLSGRARYEAFCELGAGLVDFRSVTEVLLAGEFDGPVILELDMTARKTAEQSCLDSIAYFTGELGLLLTAPVAPGRDAAGAGQ